MSIQLDLAKRVVLNLAKDAGIGGQKAKVILCIDYSGSMSRMYTSGFVEKVIQRLIPIAMAFDDDQEVEVYAFDDGIRRITPNVTEDNLNDYVKTRIMTQSMGYTNYAPAINLVVKDFLADSSNVTVSESSKSGLFGKLFGSSDNKISTGKANIPAFVIFITDGENGDRREATQSIIDASNNALFFQFIGIKSAYSDNYKYLRELDTMSGRKIDNANFFEITDKDLVESTDAAFYSKLLTEFPSFVQEARKLGMIV